LKYFFATAAEHKQSITIQAKKGAAAAPASLRPKAFFKWS
jgi:hypothetical protein